MTALLDIADYRSWAGTAASTVPDEIIDGTMLEAEAGICADLGVTIEEIVYNAQANALAKGEELRRTSRLIARRSSPEAVAGFGEAAFMVPSRDPDSARTLQAIRSVLGIPEAVA